MGFQEAISGSSWDAPRQAAARALCGQIRDSLRRSDFPAEEDRVYRNLDSDGSVPDLLSPSEPTSRLELLDELLKNGPLPIGTPLKGAVSKFCHDHKQEGNEDATAYGRVLGRVFPFAKLEKLYLRGKPASLRRRSRLRDLIGRPALRKQKVELGSTELGYKLSWSFYDPNHPGDPFRSFDRGAANMIDRLGLGKELRDSEELVKWGHWLPTGAKAHTPTAWDGGADNPWWYPGGRTRPLSADRGGTHDPNIGQDDGLPEVVHDPLTGSELAMPMIFLVN